MPSDSVSAKSAGPHYEAFTAWSEERGVTINGVQAAKISGRGLGIVAQRHIEVHQLILERQWAEYDLRPEKSLLTYLLLPY